MTVRTLAGAIARSFLAGELGPVPLAARAARMLGRRWRWLKPLAERFASVFGGSGAPPTHRRALSFLLADPGFSGAWRKYSHEIEIAAWLETPQTMRPATAARDWKVPSIESTGALAQWLELSPADLDWFSDIHNLLRRSDLSPLGHYHYRVVPKASGAFRLIESPKPRIKILQRRILREILQDIPIHSAAHGFVRGRSIRTFAAPHAGQRVVLRMDLRDFFPSFSNARIQAFFRTAGYPEAVAAQLSGICTSETPRAILNALVRELPLEGRTELRTLYGRRHLPQGAPASPMLANLCMYRADLRLAGLARAAGARYTRYADDLAFSGGPSFEAAAGRFGAHVAALLHEEGFRVHHRKTRLMRQGVRQHLAGIVVNREPNLMRPDFDRLKAILTNCVRHGPETQNRERRTDFRAYLEGHLAFADMVNPSKAERLRRIFVQIRWP
jgi:RNA-directed DNA polymerase